MNYPKRADHYWLVHVDITDHPHTMEYKITRLIPGILTRIDLYLGFRVDRKVYSMFRQITYEMGKKGEIDLFSNYPSLRKHNILADFKFILINRLHATDIEFTFFEKIFINLYFFLAKISLSDVRAFGFDTSTVFVEQVPLGSDSRLRFNLKRKLQ